MPQYGSGSLKLNISAILHMSSLGLGFIFFALASLAHHNGSYYVKSKPSYYSYREVVIYGNEQACRSRWRYGCPRGALVLASVILFCIFWVASIIALLIQLLSKSDKQTPHENACLLHVFGLFMLFAVGLLTSFLVQVSKTHFPPCSFNDYQYKHDHNEETCQDKTDYIYKYKLLIAAMVFGFAAIIVHFTAGIFYWMESNNRIGVMGMTGNAVGGPFQGNWQQQQQVQLGGGQMMTPSQTQFPQDQQQFQPAV